MTIAVRIVRGCLVVAMFSATVPSLGQGARPIAVEPGELAGRPDLVGRKVVVEDRVARFQFHPGKDFDQIFLKRAPGVIFELSERLRYKKSPRSQSVKVLGTLKREGRTLVCEVESVELLGDDLDRLNRAVGLIPRVDFEKRLAWARWAESRAEAFQDEPLRARALAIEIEALRDEADRPGPDPAGHWLALAERARGRGLPAVEWAAIAHRGLRESLKKATKAEALSSLLTRVGAFFPEAAKAPGSAADLDVSTLREKYEHDPSSTYRVATTRERSGLDRLLWVEVASRYFGQAATERPGDWINLAEEASAKLPERPEVAKAIWLRGVEVTGRDPSGLSVGEAEGLATICRDRLSDPDRATDLLRRWLGAKRRGQDGSRDAEGRIALAGHYERLLNDRDSAIELLEDAWRVVPGSPEVREEFLRRGYRESGGQWVEGAIAPASDPPSDADAQVAPARVGASGDTLLNATPDQVLARMGGKPNRRVVVATFGQMIEQWIYSDAREHRYVSFARSAQDSRPRVISYYSLPRTNRPLSSARD